MSTENSVEIKFGADTGAVKSGTNDAATAVDSAVKRMSVAFEGMAASIKGSTAASTAATESMAAGMKTALAGVEGAFASLGGHIKLITGLLAGGALLHGAVDATKEYAGEVKSLSNVFGLTAEEASKLNVQLKIVGMSASDYTSIAMKFNRQLKANEAGINELGVATRDSNGKLLSQQDLLQNATKAMMEYKAGTDRNAFAMQMFGRSAEEAYSLLKLNNETQQRAAELAQKLGLVLEQDTMAAVKKYKEEMNVTKLVMHAFQDALGEAIIPALTKMAQAFVYIGTSVMPLVKGAAELIGYAFDELAKIISGLFKIAKEVFADLASLAASAFGSAANSVDAFGVAIKAIKVGLIAFRIGLLEVVTLISNGWMQLQDTIVSALTIIYHALNMDFASAKAAWNDYWQRSEERAQRAMKRMVEIAQEGADDMAKAISGEGADKKAGQKMPQGNKTMGEMGKQTQDRSRMHEWDNLLTQQKLYYERDHDLREMSKAEQLAFWQDIQNKHALTAQEKTGVERKQLELQLEMNKDTVARRIAALKTELDAWKYDQDERLKIALKIQSEIIKRYGDGSPQAEAAAQEIIKIERAKHDQIRAIENEALAIQRAHALSVIDIEERDAQAQLSIGLITNAQMIERDLQFEDRRNEIKQNALKERLALLQQEADLNKEAIAKLLGEIQAMEDAHELKRAEILGKQRIEDAKYFTAFKNGMESSFNGVIATFLKGTTSIKDAMKGMISAVMDAFTNMIAQWAAKWLANQVMQKVGDRVMAVSQIMSNAAVAGSAAFASTAAIPMVGAELAPAAAASAYAGAASFVGSIPAAAKGYDIPAGVNPLTQLHEREMVLPAKQADVIRGMADGGGGASPINISISAMDAKGVRDLFMREGSALADAIKNQARTFGLSSGSLKGI